MSITDKLYNEIADKLNLTVLELKKRLCTGEPLVQSYYEWKYRWNLNDDTTISF